MTTEKRKVLGRGLETLLPSRPIPHAPTSAPIPPDAAAPHALARSDNDVRHLPLDQLDANPYQTRGPQLDPASLAELAASIQAVGVLQPIVVRPVPGGRYHVIAGERRRTAAAQAGLTSIPAIVRQVSNQQAMEMTIIENLLREDLNPLEQARAFDRLAREFGLTQEQMAVRTGKDRSSIANFMRILKLPLEVQDMLALNRISLSHAKALMPLPSPAEIERLARRIVEEGLSVRYTEQQVEALLHPHPKPEKPARQVDPNVREAESVLQQALGVKVTIDDRGGKGTIHLEYSTIDDYDRILAALSTKQ